MDEILTVFLLELKFLVFFSILACRYAGTVT